MKNIGILLFEDVEVLDFAGPFEVFSVTSILNNHGLYNVFTVSKSLAPVLAVNRLSVNPTYCFENAPKIDILIVPGGIGTRKILNDSETLNWVKKIDHTTLYTVSICSGSLILGLAGLLNKKKFCTHRSTYQLMEELVPDSIPQRKKRFIQDGKVFTSAGISAGIDLSFYLIEKEHGKTAADATAYYMEYKNY